MHKLLAIVCLLDILMAVLDCALYLDIGQLIDIKRFLVWKGRKSKYLPNLYPNMPGAGWDYIMKFLPLLL